MKATPLPYLVIGNRLIVAGHIFNIEHAPRFVKTTIDRDQSTIRLWGRPTALEAWRQLETQPYDPTRRLG